MCENLGIYIIYFYFYFSFGQSLKKIIMIIEKKNFERALLKCIKLQVSNVFSIKLNYFFPENVKDVYILEKSSKMKFKVFHLDKI
jgi:hypothetical protein